jgi:septal ring-binding cell division protein DamX
VNVPLRSLPEHLSRNWLSEISDDLYDLQILGSHSRDQVHRYLRELGSQGEYAWFETRFRHEKWYVVVKGVYPNRQSAINAVKETRKITGQKSWPRRLGSIKQEVAALYNN